MKGNLFSKLFNTSDNRYFIIYFLNLILIQYQWNQEAGFIRGLDFTMITFPLFWLIIFQTPVLHTSFQSRRVNGNEKIFWVLLNGLLSWFGYIFYRILTKEKRLSEEDYLIEQKEKYWFNFGLALLGIFLNLVLIV
tara:strand:+ start:122 stop:529 length:408 start_codon:yes stop_codon:yes gene_type:complete